MNRLARIILVLSMLIFVTCEPIKAITQENMHSNEVMEIEDENATYAIASEVWYSDWYEHIELQGYNASAPYADITLEITYRFYATYRYNEATGKIYGSVPTLYLEVYDANNVTESMWIESLDYDAAITSDGYNVRFSNITFVLGGRNSLDNADLTFAYTRVHPRVEVLPD